MNNFVNLWDREVIPSFDSRKEFFPSKICPLGLSEGRLGLSRSWVETPWEPVLEGRGVQEGWTSSKKENPKGTGAGFAHEPRGEQAGRKPAWLDRGLTGTQGKRRVSGLWKKQKAAQEEQMDVVRL